MQRSVLCTDWRCPYRRKSHGFCLRNGQIRCKGKSYRSHIQVKGNCTKFWPDRIQGRRKIGRHFRRLRCKPWCGWKLRTACKFIMRTFWIEIQNPLGQGRCHWRRNGTQRGRKERNSFRSSQWGQPSMGSCNSWSYCKRHLRPRFNPQFHSENKGSDTHLDRHAWRIFYRFPDWRRRNCSCSKGKAFDRILCRRNSFNSNAEPSSEKCNNKPWRKPHRTHLRKGYFRIHGGGDRSFRGNIYIASDEIQGTFGKTWAHPWRNWCL